jgi:hypothetical protein
MVDLWLAHEHQQKLGIDHEGLDLALSLPNLALDLEPNQNLDLDQLLKPGQLGLCIDLALGRDLGAMNLKPDLGQGTPLLRIPDQ